MNRQRDLKKKGKLYLDRNTRLAGEPWLCFEWVLVQHGATCREKNGLIC